MITLFEPKRSRSILECSGKYLLLFLCVVLLPSFSTAQERSSTIQERGNSVAVGGGMGVFLVAAPNLVDYINSIAYSTERVDYFGTAVEFFGTVELPVSAEWGLKVEHSYLFKSYNILSQTGGTSTIGYDVHSPSVLVQYCVPGKGYFFKFGAGGGYHFGSLTVSNSLYGTDSSYTARGIGIRCEAAGQTAFDEHLFGYISGSLDWEFLGTAQNSAGVVLQNAGIKPSLSYFALGVRFGLMYYF